MKDSRIGSIFLFSLLVIMIIINISIVYGKDQKLLICVFGELAWRSGCVMDCHATALGSIPVGNGEKTELHVLRKRQLMGVPSLNDLAVDGMLNTAN